jgi:hypothetical protein
MGTEDPRDEEIRQLRAMIATLNESTATPSLMMPSEPAQWLRVWRRWVCSGCVFLAASFVLLAVGILTASGRLAGVGALMLAPSGVSFIAACVQWGLNDEPPVTRPPERGRGWYS